MDDGDLADVFDLLDRPQTPQGATQAFRADLDRLGLSQRALAAKMKALGDARAFDTLLRSVQRMATGEARVSGEMQVIMTMLLRERTRAQRLLGRTVWSQGEGGGLLATVEGVALSLSPQTRGRWQIHAQVDETRGYSPPIPHWRNSLEEAKLRAMLCIDETLDQAQLA